METILKTQHVKLNTVASVTSLKRSSFWQQMEASRFAIIPILLVAVVCSGGIAAGFGAKDDILRIALVAFPTILTLAFTLAVAPMRLILWSAVISVILHTAVLIF